MINDYEKIYIQDLIICHLERLVKGEALVKNLPWNDMTASAMSCHSKGGTYMITLHQMMRPYYEMYLFADSIICNHEYPESRSFIENVIRIDKEFGIWASSQDLISATESWGEFMKLKRDSSISYYFRLLRGLFFENKIYYDLEKLSKELDEILFNSETNADYKTGELLCVLHATVKILLQNWNDQKKLNTFDLLFHHWDFLKHVYSVMIRRIVGSRLANFASLTNIIEMTNDNHPHAQIYYCVLMDRIESLHLKEKQYKSTENALERLRTNILDKTKPSEILYELCDTIFPEEFQRILNDYRPKSYDEVESESKKKDELLKKVKEERNQLNDRLSAITHLLTQMAESSITMKEIEDELMKYPSGIAWTMLEKLNNDLSWNPIWREHYPEIRDKCSARLRDSANEQAKLMELASRPTYNYEAGAIHDDKRSQLLLGEERKKLVQLKRLSNE